MCKVLQEVIWCCNPYLLFLFSLFFFSFSSACWPPPLVSSPPLPPPLPSSILPIHLTFYKPSSTFPHLVPSPRQVQSGRWRWGGNRQDSVDSIGWLLAQFLWLYGSVIQHQETQEAHRPHRFTRHLCHPLLLWVMRERENDNYGLAYKYGVLEKRIETDMRSLFLRRPDVFLKELKWQEIGNTLKGRLVQREATFF